MENKILNENVSYYLSLACIWLLLLSKTHSRLKLWKAKRFLMYSRDLVDGIFSLFPCQRLKRVFVAVGQEAGLHRSQYLEKVMEKIYRAHAVYFTEKYHNAQNVWRCVCTYFSGPHVLYYIYCFDNNMFAITLLWVLSIQIHTYIYRIIHYTHLCITF